MCFAILWLLHNPSKKEEEKEEDSAVGGHSIQSSSGRECENGCRLQLHFLANRKSQVRKCWVFVQLIFGPRRPMNN